MAMAPFFSEALFFTKGVLPWNDTFHIKLYPQGAHQSILRWNGTSLLSLPQFETLL